MARLLRCYVLFAHSRFCLRKSWQIIFNTSYCLCVCWLLVLLLLLLLSVQLNRWCSHIILDAVVVVIVISIIVFKYMISKIKIITKVFKIIIYIIIVLFDFSYYWLLQQWSPHNRSSLPAILQVIFSFFKLFIEILDSPFLLFRLFLPTFC